MFTRWIGYFRGSVFVTLRAKDHLKSLPVILSCRPSWFYFPPPELLNDSRFVDDVDDITDCFDKTTKPRFRNPSDPQFVKFGSRQDNDPGCGIRFGQVKLAGYSHIHLCRICRCSLMLQHWCRRIFPAVHWMYSAGGRESKEHCKRKAISRHLSIFQKQLYWPTSSTLSLLEALQLATGSLHVSRFFC